MFIDCLLLSANYEFANFLHLEKCLLPPVKHCRIKTRKYYKLMYVDKLLVGV